MGNYLVSAAETLGLNYSLADMREAETKNRLVQKFYWHLCDKKPAHLGRFATQILKTCAELKPAIVLTTGGRAPLERSHIQKLHAIGSKVINYSTDDPWNPVLRATWFLSTLPAYDAIFTPRRTNMDDFRRAHVRNIHYMPFAYDPNIHRAWNGGAPAMSASDVLFVGACDSERLPLIAALADAGLRLALYGRYWDVDAKTRPFARGVADQDSVRAASAAASVCLCLVRRGNRDHHVMRSFEAASIGGCILAEDTEDHRELFGPDGVAARYFRTIDDLVKIARDLSADREMRARMSDQLRSRMRERRDAYADRLAEMLRLTYLAHC